MLCALFVGIVVVPAHRRFFDRAVHALGFPVRKGLFNLIRICSSENLRSMAHPLIGQITNTLVAGFQGARSVGVVSTVGDDSASLDDIWRKALSCLCNIGAVACCQTQANRPARAITDQMRFRVQTTLGLADSAPAGGVFLTPLAAIRWVLTWLASIIRGERLALSRARVLNARSNTPASDRRL